jgi:hypothetical protein
MVKAGAAASADYEKGVAVFVYSQGGLMLEAGIGAQKFIFRPSVLGRGKKAAHVKQSPKAKPPSRTKPLARAQ